jgi:flagellar motor switch protein FliM
VINKLSATFWYSSASHELSDDQLKKLRDKIDYVEVPISVEVGKSKLDTQEVINLEVGDIIKLDTGLDEPFELIINGRPKYYCQPGQKGQSMAIQLLEPMEEEEFIAEMLNDLKEDIFDEEFEGEAISHG